MKPVPNHPSTTPATAAYGHAVRIGIKWFRLVQPMKLVTFSTGDGDRPGVVDAEREVVHDLSAVLPAGTGVLDLVEGWAGYADVVGRAGKSVV